MNYGACYPLHPLLSRAVASRGDGSLAFEAEIIGSRRTSPQFCGRCQNLNQSECGCVAGIPTSAKDALDEVAKKMGKNRNRKIKVPNKFRATKVKAPTNECKCLTFN